MELGFDEFKLEIRDKMLLASMGRFVPTKAEAEWMDKVGRYMMKLTAGGGKKDTAPVAPWKPEDVPEVGDAAPQVPDFLPAQGEPS